MKKRICVLLLLFAASIFAQSVDFTVLAMVGDRVITNFDVESAVMSEMRSLPADASPAELAKTMAALRENALESVINYELAYLEFTALKASIPRNAVQRRINDIITERASGSQDKFDDLLFKENMTRKEFEERIYKDIAVEAFIFDRVRRNVEVTDEAIQEYFEEHADEANVPAEYLVSVIALKKDGAFAETGSAEKAGELIAALAQGADFAELAKQHSEGMNGSEGGCLGWQREMAPALQKIVDGLKPGEVAPQPLELGNSFYVVKLDDYKPASVATLTPEVKANIKYILTKQIEKQKYEQLFDDLAKKYNVIRFDK